MSAYSTPVKTILTTIFPVIGAVASIGNAYAAPSNYTVVLDKNFATGRTATVNNINDFPTNKDNADFKLELFKRSDLNQIYLNSRLNTQNNKPVFTAFNQDPNVPNQQRLTYLNVQAALDTMLYGDDPARKKVHLASLNKKARGSNKDEVNGFGTKIAVVDSGINTKQPDFTNKVEVTDLGGQKYANQVTHGTTVALTAAGANDKYQGVAPGAKVKAYAIDPENVVLEDVFVTVYKDKVSVANASFTLGDDTSIFPSIRNTFYKIFNNPDAPLYVFAAGNKDTASSTFSPLLQKLIEDPKIMSNTLVVSGVRISNPKAPVSANNLAFDPDAISCSNVKYNCLTAFFAYDVPNPKATKSGDDYVTSYGTSFAAPQVSGGAALVKQMFPWFNADNIRQTLLTTATDIGPAGIDDKTGWGLLNVGAAVRGPAQFAFGDFVVDFTPDKVSSNREVFYFRNNIFGKYGLVVRDNGDSQRTLILTGKNTYKGHTTVQSGILRLEGSVTSTTNIDHDGLFQLASTATSGDIYNNGFFVSFGGEVKGSYSNSPLAISTLTLGKPLEVTGEAKLNGALVVDIPSDFKPQPGSAYLVLKAGQLTNEFKTLTITGNSNLKGQLFYDYTNGQVAIKFN
ncbi:S8 family serine peptidase [Psittacicella hinzii]|nr:S8 family serine peptidase [Psittacicella hinzii]